MFEYLPHQDPPLRFLCFRYNFELFIIKEFAGDTKFLKVNKIYIAITKKFNMN